MISALIVASSISAIPHAHAVNQPLPRSTPEAQGISSQAIRDYIEAADKIEHACTASCSCGTASDRRGVVEAGSGGQAARAVLAEQELQLDRRRAGDRRRQA